MMTLQGKVWKDGKFWLIECAAIRAMTQGTSKRDALSMMVDWIQTTLDRPDFAVEIREAGEGEFVMSFPDPAPVLALVAGEA
jgi:predicted RNase H-like HicB family nuclease